MRTINSNVKPSQLQLGDTVLVRQQKTYKLSTPYDLKRLVITDKKGTVITAEKKRQDCNTQHFIFQTNGR